MLVWGSATKSVDAGDAGQQACPVCKENRQFQYLLSYRMHHIWYLIRWSTSQKYYTVCGVCNNAFNAEPPAAQDAGVSDGKKPKNQISFFDRWSWALALGAIALFVSWAIIDGNADNAQDLTYVAAPKVGDRYIVKMDDFTGLSQIAGGLGGNYGVVRVAAIDANNNVTINLPKLVWSKSSKLRSEIIDAAQQDSYYDGEIVKPVAELSALYKSRTIQEVER